MEFLLSTLASYLAGNIPSIKKFFGLDKRLGWCFWKARNHWNEAAADRYKGKNKQLRADLVEFIQGNKPENDEELEQLLALWVAEIKKEKDGYDFILEKKIEGVDSHVVGLSDEVKARIGEMVSSLEEGFKMVGEKVDGVGEKIDGVEEKVDLVGEKVDGVGQKVDGVGELVGEVRDLVAESDTKIDRILKKLNKLHLICLNDCLLKSHTLPGGEINARRLTDGSFWSDEACIGMAIEGLKHHPYFVIKGAEGRGKSILSYQVALDLIINEDYMVFVTDKSWSWQEIYNDLDVLLEGDEPVLVLLENIHQAENDLSNIYNYPKDHRGNGNHLFLMNRRPIGKNADGSENGEEGAGCLLDLDDIQEIRAGKTAEYLAGSEGSGLDIEKLFVDGEKLSKNLPPNLRVLSRYFQIFKDKKVTNVREEDILNLFEERFRLNNAKTGLLDCLMMLGSINIFDVPLDTVALSEKDSDILKAFLSDKDSKGLYYKQGAKLFLPHSTDATFLCKAICRNNLRPNEELRELYVESVTDTVIAYYEALIKKSKASRRKSVLEDIANDFRSFISSLVKMEEFGALLEYFREPDKAKEIIRTICPRFVIGALVGDGSDLERLSIYKDSIPFIKSNLSRYNFVFFSLLFVVLRHYNEYKDDQLVKDIFFDASEDELRELLLKHDHIQKDRFYYKMKNLDIFNKVVNDIRLSHPGFVKNTHPKKHPEGISRIQSELTVVTRYLKEGEVTIQDVQGKIEALIREIKDMTASAPDKNPAYIFSYIFRDLGIIDSMTDASFKKFKPDLMKDKTILADARKRLANFNYGRETFYYFSHFYNDDFPELRDGLKERITRVTSPKIMVKMIYWICYVRNAYKPENLNTTPFGANSLACDVEKIVLTDAQTRLRSFFYSRDDFFYFSYLYNGAYPDIRDSVKDLITNVKSKWERKGMSDWIHKLDQNPPLKSFPMALADAVREQLGRPASSQGESEDE